MEQSGVLKRIETHAETSHDWFTNRGTEGPSTRIKTPFATLKRLLPMSRTRVSSASGRFPPVSGSDSGSDAGVAERLSRAQAVNVRIADGAGARR